MMAHIARERIVYTAQEDGWPVGLLTAVLNEDGGVHLEHVVTFRRDVLLPMLRGALAYAWSEAWTYVTFHIPRAHPLARGLMAVGRRLGFTEYQPTFWVAYRP